MTKAQAVEQIVTAYTETRMTVHKFEQMVGEILTQVEEDGSSTNTMTYEKGFDDGWAACLAEGK